MDELMNVQSKWQSVTATYLKARPPTDLVSEMRFFMKDKSNSTSQSATGSQLVPGRIPVGAVVHLLELRRAGHGHVLIHNSGLEGELAVGPEAVLGSCDVCEDRAGLCLVLGH